MRRRGEVALRREAALRLTEAALRLTSKAVIEQ
jgi:hypothetical protein